MWLVENYRELYSQITYRCTIVLVRENQIGGLPRTFETVKNLPHSGLPWALENVKNLLYSGLPWVEADLSKLLHSGLLYTVKKWWIYYIVASPELVKCDDFTLYSGLP